jgi:ABC-type proline/glycine betaine transport system permease subunit
VAPAPAAPISGVVPAATAPDSAKLQAARGWVDLIKSIPPVWVLIFLVGCIGFGATIAVFVVLKYMG